MDIWHVKPKTPPPAHALLANQLTLHGDSSGPSADDLVIVPQYPVESYLLMQCMRLTGFLLLKFMHLSKNWIRVSFPILYA